MSEWILVEDRFPKEEQKVWYYFEETGVSRGEFLGFHPCYAGLVDGDGNDVSHPKCKLPNCKLNKGCTGIPYFGGERGVLGGDVTHWMPDTGGNDPRGDSP